MRQVRVGAAVVVEFEGCVIGVMIASVCMPYGVREKGDWDLIYWIRLSFK